jgi:RNA polymerase sigma factor (sigma-70 family)
VGVTLRNRSTPDPEAGIQQLTQVFQGYRKALAKLIARIVRPHDIEDIVQETYIRIYQASQKKTIFHARSFMLKTARNLALNHVARADALNYLEQQVDREADPNEPAFDYESDVVDSPDSVLQSEEEFLLFCRSVRDLSLQCRRAFILRKVYGLSQRDVAKRLGIAESTVEKHIAKGITTASAYMKLHGYARSRSRPGRMQTAGGDRNE